jgi:hypothetical protein
MNHVTWIQHMTSIYVNRVPFVKYIEYGQGKEGYWTYDNMALQCEACIDCIQAFFPQFESLWQFNYSCGDDKGETMG